jgi:predicted dehydrogenase
MKPICVGIVGSGFVAELHMRACRRAFGLDVTIKAVVSRGDHVLAFAKRFGIPETFRDYRELLTDKTIGRRHLHAAGAARRNDRRLHARGQARDL